MPGGHRRYCWTVWQWGNPAELLGAAKPDNVRYAIWQEEVCPDTSRHHLQGYIVFTESLSVGRVQRLLGDPTAHVDAARNCEDDCVAYCSKQDTRAAGPWTVGERTERGQRVDLEQALAFAKSGQTDLEILEAAPKLYARNYRAIRECRAIWHPPQERDVTTLVIWGPTGTGKTTAVMRQYHPFRVTWTREGTIWWDGYQGEKAVLFDDFSGAVPLEQMLHLLDRWPLRLQVKGSTTTACWTLVLITANDPPDAWYPMCSRERQAALARRLTTVYNPQTLAETQALILPQIA